jgi:GT2 family glycosyltransferase
MTETTAHPIIAVLMASHNRKEATLNCLDFLMRQKAKLVCMLDVYLLDDGSTDGTSDAVSRQFPSIRIVNGDGNLYWNRGMQKIWKLASEEKDYDYYLWLNDDVLLHENFLATLIETSRLYEKRCIIVGSCSAIGNEDEITYGGMTSKGKRISPANIPMPCDFFNGNIVLVPCAVFQKVGTNDPFWRHGFGDCDYGLRAKKLGFSSMIAPGILGECNRHDADGWKWRNPQIAFYDRMKILWGPKGANPKEWFAFEKRHKGVFPATLKVMKILFQAFAPRLSITLRKFL